MNLRQRLQGRRRWHLRARFRYDRATRRILIAETIRYYYDNVRPVWESDYWTALDRAFPVMRVKTDVTA